MTAERKRTLVKLCIVALALLLVGIVVICANKHQSDNTTEDPNANQPDGVTITSEVEIKE